MRPSMPREKNPSGYGTRSTDPAAVRAQREQRIGVVPFASGTFGAEAQRVVADRRSCNMEVGGDRRRARLKRGPGDRIERPAFAAVLRRRRPRARESTALAPVEAREVAAAGERRPDHAVRVDVDAARRVAVHVDAGCG